MRQILTRLTALALSVLPALLALPFGRAAAQADTLPLAFNTPYAERSPVLSPDGDWIFFTIDGHPQNLGLDDEADIWAAQRQPDGQWGRLLNVGAPVNSRQPDDIAACGPAASWLLLFRAGQAPRLALRQGRSWTLAEAIALPNWSSWEGVSHCFLNAQADLLLLAARREGGFGGADLYAARRQPDGRWGEAFNLGPAVNTAKDEGSPWLSPDGMALYFTVGRGRQAEWMLSRRTTWDGGWPAPASTGIRLAPARGGGPVATLFPDGRQALMASAADSSGLPGLLVLPLPESFRPRPMAVVRGYCALPGSTTHPEADVYCQWLERPGELPLPLGAGSRYCALAPSGAAALIGARLAGYISPPIGLGLAPEQLDEDPGRGAVMFSPEYYQRDANLKNLQTRYAAAAAALSARRSAWEDKFTGLIQSAAALLAMPMPALERQSRLDYEGLIRWDTSRWQLPFDDLFAAAQGKALSTAATRALGEQLANWLGARYEGDSRPWAEAAENLRNSITQALKTLLPAAPAGGYTQRQSHFQDSLSARMAPLLYNSLADGWKPVIPDLLSLDLDIRSATSGQSSLEAELERLVLEQIKEEESRSSSFADMAPMTEAPAPTAANSPNLPAELSFIPLRTGVVVPLEYVYFVPNAPRLRADAELELNHWIEWLQAHPQVKIRIGCHSHDGMGHALAYRLSGQRARAVVDYLAAKGISRDRLSAKGYGKMAPLDPGDTIEARKKNQRVEITILAAP